MSTPSDDNAITLELALPDEPLRPPAALLFDLDGVLADVSGSYNACILATAAGFGVEVTPEDVATLKAAGNANNDWELTWRLVTSRGVEASLEEVTRRFEDLYQGTEAAPGLRRTERLICEPSWLRRLHARLPLAIVTGRPRSDALRFLDEHRIARFFGAVVCMEDGPLKPDPAPVLKALDALEVGSGWFVGDTPDDMRAARHAGQQPLAVVAPGDEYATMAPALIEAGAARLLRTVHDIEGLLP